MKINGENMVLLFVLPLIAVALEIAIAVFFAFKSLQAYDRGNRVRIFAYGLVSIYLSFTYVRYADQAQVADPVMVIAMSAFMLMVAYPFILLFGKHGAFSGTGEDSETKKLRREKLDTPLPAAAPLPYRILRGIVQHFPYRIALVAFGVYVYFWHMDAQTVTSTFIFLGYCALALANGIYPFMTKPLRYGLISGVDSVFERVCEFQKKRRARTAEVVRSGDGASDE